MSFIKKMDTGEVPHDPSNDELLDFPKGTKYYYDNQVWVVTEEIVSGPDVFRRCKSTDSTDDEISTLKSLQKLSENKNFSFVK